MRMNELDLSGLGLPAPVFDHGLLTGRIVGTTPDGQVLVDYPGNTQGPLVARVLDHSQAVCRRDAEVLLFLDRGDPARPIVLGTLAAAPAGQPAAAADEVEIRGRRQLTLRCGRSSISLFADGRIVLKGTRILSRASESNKIKGAVIALN